MSQPQGGWSDLWKKEDWWAIWLALGIIGAALIFFFAGSTIKPIAVAPKKWSSLAEVGKHLAASWPWYLAQLVMWLGVFSLSVKFLGLNVRQYVPGFLILYLLALVIIIFSSWKTAERYNLEAPLVALLVGLIASNLFKLPRWLDVSFRTEFYVKTGIILLGATLPLTMIYRAGFIAFIQATIVSLATFFTIYFVSTRVFKLDRKFGAVMGAGGSVCGVSATIAVGGAVGAKKEHMAIGISIVAVWAIVMIFVLPIVCKALHLPAGVAGAWIGTSEFADAAGFAAAAAIGSEAAIQTYTLMKVIGRDIWIGLWSFILAVIAVVVWEKKELKDKSVSALEIWYRFPKFVLGFFAASALITLVALHYPGDAFKKTLSPDLIAPLKTLRSWTFIFTFLSIGFTTRFRELFKFGWNPFLAFSIGVAVNVPLGFVLSYLVFDQYWIAING
jgi:uncharacterized integral membrane protein (TIGR00698 family)